MRKLKLAICAVYFTVLVLLSFNMPFSMFYRTFHSFDKLFRYVEHKNEIRTKKGKDYFSHMESTSSLEFYKKQIQTENLLLAIGIISIKRSSGMGQHKSLGYLYQSAASIDFLMKTKEVMGNSFAFVCNVDLHPKAHKDAQEISRYMPYAERFGNNSIGLPQDLKLPNSSISYKNVNKHTSIYEKENYDYVFCMNAAAALKPKYILLVEEDAIPHKDFTSVLNNLMKYHLDENPHGHNFSFFKFYFPSKWQGFSLRLTEILDLISFSSLGATLFLLFSYSYSMIYERHFIHLKKDFFVGFLISLMSCFIIGRQNINELRRLSPNFYRVQSSEICCTQAMLYPAQLAPRLSHYMVSEAFLVHTDLLIWDFTHMEKLPSFQVEPNIFHHIGLHSSLGQKQKHPEEFIFSD